MNGWPTTSRSGCFFIATCMSEGFIPEVEEPTMALAGACVSISASTLCFRSSRSGTLSWMKSASATASAMVLAKVSLPSLGRPPGSICR